MESCHSLFRILKNGGKVKKKAGKTQKNHVSSKKKVITT